MVKKMKIFPFFVLAQLYAVRVMNGAYWSMLEG